MSSSHVIHIADFSPRHLTDPGVKSPTTPKDLKVRPQLRTPIPQRRGSWAAVEASPKERLSSGRRFGDAQTNADSDLRSARLARRAKTMTTTDSDRRSSRISAAQNYNEDDEDSDMADKEPTFDKEYVDQHPEEKFYHTGNGWYKRGARPRGHKNAKRRESEGHAIMRRSDGSFAFDNHTTIHVSQLDLYPGVEFHHCGNGWYKPGPDNTGHRTSRVGGKAYSDEGAVEDEDEDEEDEDEDEVVSKEYARSHPDVEWVHRGNGRYKRKSAIGASAPVSASYPSQEPERDQTIYSKAYVQAHPEEQFHHRGNARYMRGPPPEHWASVKRRKSAPALTTTQDDNTVLFSKAYVDAHPEETFHHRGQGRYARGPRRMHAQDDDEDLSDGAQDGLVDTDYVDAHPNETFHHRGQGRWARGLPQPGASNKVAIRGPGAKDKTDGTGSHEEEDEANKPPPLTALVLKTEGPDKWPELTWFYRGGGKWARITKQEFEEMQRGGAARRGKGKGRMRNVDGPEAQLEREVAAAEAARRMGDDDGFQRPGEMGINGMSIQERPKIKRRRTGKRGSYLTQEPGLMSKQHSTNSQSQAPTPKPRMLEPEEDILTEEDLPSLYRDRNDWSPASEPVEGQAPKNAGYKLYEPINPPEKFVKSLTKHDPRVRTLENLKRIAANSQAALDSLQQEYLMLERITAPHARIPRKPAKGGRAPLDTDIFEDKKEADLYDYAYDPRRIGYQDPQAQKIQRDVDGRELRNRRNRSGVQNNGTLPGWNFGEDEIVGPRRAVKPVNRFDGIVDSPRKRARNSTTASKAPSMTPDRAATPLGGPARSGYVAQTSGRLTLSGTGNVPKRVRELRDDSVGLASVGKQRDVTPGGTARKGRPPGSKNLHKRKDAGIKKGPRKPKVVDSIETLTGSEVDGEDEMGEGEGEDV